MPVDTHERRADAYARCVNVAYERLNHAAIVEAHVAGQVHGEAVVRMSNFRQPGAASRWIARQRLWVRRVVLGFMRVPMSLVLLVETPLEVMLRVLRVPLNAWIDMQLSHTDTLALEAKGDDRS